MTTTYHALGRIAERLTAEERSAVAAKLAELNVKPTGSVAVRIHRLAAMRGYAWSDTSNGSDVWAIVRDGTVMTVMLRRSTQPTNPNAFNVDRVQLAD